MGCVADPNANTRHTDNFECVVTPNVRQRLEERDAICIVVDVRLRTKSAQMKEKRSEEKEAVRNSHNV